MWTRSLSAIVLPIFVTGCTGATQLPLRETPQDPPLPEQASSFHRGEPIPRTAPRLFVPVRLPVLAPSCQGALGSQPFYVPAAPRRSWAIASTFESPFAPGRDGSPFALPNSTNGWGSANGSPGFPGLPQVSFSYDFGTVVPVLFWGFVSIAVLGAIISSMSWGVSVGCC